MIMTTTMMIPTLVMISLLTQADAAEFSVDVQKIVDGYLTREDKLSRNLPELCHYPPVCADGTHALQSTLKITPDGCGSGGLYILPVKKDLVECCDEHDICYGTCGVAKRKCDNDFRNCLTNKCLSEAGENRSACTIATKVFSLATLALGCAAFEDAQKDACYCPGSNKTRSFITVPQYQRKRFFPRQRI